MKLGAALLLATLAFPLAAAAAPGGASPLARMQQHMDHMQQTMKELHAAKTAKKREALLQTHMQQMMAAMTTMGETMGGGMAGGGMMGAQGGMMNGGGMMHGQAGHPSRAPAAKADEGAAAAPASPDHLQTQIDRLTTRLDMLQQMLDQMLQQQEQLTRR